MQVCSGLLSLAHAPFPYIGRQLIAVAAVVNPKCFVGLISFGLHSHTVYQASYPQWGVRMEVVNSSLSERLRSTQDFT